MVLIYQFTMALEAPYENWPTSPAKALVDEVNRIAPIPRASMCGRAYLHAHTPPSTLTLTMSSKTLVSTAIKSRYEGSEEAALWTALLNRMSIRPKAERVASIMRSEEHTSELQSLMRTSNSVC